MSLGSINWRGRKWWGCRGTQWRPSRRWRHNEEFAKNFCWNLWRYVMLKQNTLLMEMLDYWLSKFRDKEPRSWYTFHWPHTETDSAAYLWSLLSTSVWSPIQKKFPLYAWVSAKTLNFENTYPQHFEWNSLSKRLREAFWNLKHYCSNLISWMYRCNQFSFFLW